MDTIQTRDEFKAWIRSIFDEKNMDSEKSAVWIPEHDMNGVKCQWFVTVPCVNVSRYPKYKSDYWMWCANNLTGHVRCFWSNPDDDEECWGFTNKDDIHWWMLKWIG